MKKSEIFEKVLNVVSYFTEVEKENILSKCRKADFIDARCMLVNFCREKQYIRDQQTLVSNVLQIQYCYLQIHFIISNPRHNFATNY